MTGSTPPGKTAPTPSSSSYKKASPACRETERSSSSVPSYSAISVCTSQREGGLLDGMAHEGSHQSHSGGEHGSLAYYLPPTCWRRGDGHAQAGFMHEWLGQGATWRVGKACIGAVLQVPAKWGGGRVGRPPVCELGVSMEGVLWGGRLGALAIWGMCRAVCVCLSVCDICKPRGHPLL